MFTPTPVYGPGFKSKFQLRGIRLAEGEDGAADASALADADKGESDDVKALRGVADKRMRERNEARDELKKFSDLGLSADEIKTLIDARDKGTAPDAEKIERTLRAKIEADAREKSAGKFRASNVREQAATLGFNSPKDALALLDSKALAAVDVDDDDEVDAAAVKKLLEALAKEKPYLLKNTDTTATASDAGIGATGSGTKPEVQPGTPRLAAAYANSTKK